MLEATLRSAVRSVPSAESLWLMAARHKWRKMRDVEGARQILREAFSANPESEEIWLTAAELELESGEHERARALLANARARAPTQRVWMKSALLEWELGSLDAELELLASALALFPKFDKLWLMSAQALVRRRSRS
jgi:pre-mRNA-processing factor 6